MDPRAAWLSWIEIDADAFRHNMGLFRARLASNTRLLLVVKANAYGHGLASISALAESAGADWLGVHALEEGIAARSHGWTRPVLIMGYVANRNLSRLLTHRLEPTVFDLETVESLDRLGSEQGVRVRCHLKLETGTNRQGIPPEDLDVYLTRFARAEGLTLAGLSTHFANIEDTTDSSYARGQLARYVALAAQVESAGFTDLLRHTACTAALLTLPETQFDLVRLGLGAYGLWPSRETRASLRTASGPGVELRPVLTWKTRVSQLKWIEAGAFVGYGCTVRTSHRTRLAVLPIGYADGYDRGLSSLGHVLVRGRRAPVLGRVCMNITLVDVTDIPDAALEDEVVLLGRQGDDEVSAERLAQLAQTIPYEIVSRLSPALPRLVVNAPDSPAELLDRD